MKRSLFSIVLCTALLCACTIDSRPPSYMEQSSSQEEQPSSTHPASTPEPVIDEIILAEEAVEEVSLPEASSPEASPAEEAVLELEPASTAEPAVDAVEEAADAAELPTGEPAAALQALEAENPVVEAELPPLDPESIESSLLGLINQERLDNQIDPLEMEDAMLWAARIRAPEVVEGLSHTRPDDTPYYTAFDEAGFSYAGRFHGENVSYMYFPAGIYTSSEAAQQMFDRLAESSGHYLNMLSPNFDLTGIGVHVVQEEDTVYIYSAQLFASR